MNHHNNIVRIKAVNKALGQLGDIVVFVGGATSKEQGAETNFRFVSLSFVN